MLPAMNKTPRIPVAVQQAVMNSLRHHLQLASARLERTFPEPALLYQQRGTSAGTAWLEKWQIRLNPQLLLENQQAFVEEVVPHELAHLLVWQVFGRVAPHGKEWKWMMQEVFGVSPRRTHSFALTSLAAKTFPYYCRCQQHQLTVRRHNRVLRGESRYHCRLCQSELHPGRYLPC